MNEKEGVRYGYRDLCSLVWSLNSLRRQLTASQRAMIAAVMSQMSALGRPKALTGPETLPDGGVSVTQPQAAKVTGVSARHTSRAAAVRKEDQTLAAKVHAGEITVSAALREIEDRKIPPKDPPPNDQPNLVHRDSLRRALKIGVQFKKNLAGIAEFSRPFVPDETTWKLETELKAMVSEIFEMSQGLCATEPGKSWDHWDRDDEVGRATPLRR